MLVVDPVKCIASLNTGWRVEAVRVFSFFVIIVIIIHYESLSKSTVPLVMPHCL